MVKRTVAVLLWFYVGLMVGSAVSIMTGLDLNLGLILGLAAAGLVGTDPRGLIWRPDTRSGRPSSGSQPLN